MDHSKTMNNFEEVMRAHKMRITPQKKAIYEALISTTSHPTAEELYTTVKKEFANISLATVYDNLRKFTDLGLGVMLFLGDGIARFDGNVSSHHHVLDSATGAVHDVEALPIDDIAIPQGLQGKVKDIQITYIT